ncbi:MAG: hypothetical protein QE271_04640 [Bacteriovoracaceae bacterium]|nr:hypothetical protein [Bacteriovoracaceae bacterium]
MLKLFIKILFLSLAVQPQISHATRMKQNTIKENTYDSYDMTVIFTPEEMLNAFASRYNVKFVKIIDPSQRNAPDYYSDYRPLFKLPDIEESKYFNDKRDEIRKIISDIHLEFNQNAIRGESYSLEFFTWYYKQDLQELENKIHALPGFSPNLMNENIKIVTHYFKSMEDIGIKITRFVNDDKVTYEFDQGFFQNYYSVSSIEELPNVTKEKLLNELSTIYIALISEYNDSYDINGLIGFNEIGYFQNSIKDQLKARH